jgi:hypothetical protein
MAATSEISGSGRGKWVVAVLMAGQMDAERSADSPFLVLPKGRPSAAT